MDNNDDIDNGDKKIDGLEDHDDMLNRIHASSIGDNSMIRINDHIHPVNSSTTLIQSASNDDATTEANIHNNSNHNDDGSRDNDDEDHEDNDRRKQRRKHTLNFYKRFVPRKREQSKSDYLLRLEKRGKRLRSTYKKKLQQSMNFMNHDNPSNIPNHDIVNDDEKDPLGETTKNAIASTWSDDEEDDDPDNRVQNDLQDIVDWYRVAGTYGTDYRLMDALPVKELDSLVGWATHLTHDGTRMMSPTSPRDVMVNNHANIPNDTDAVVNVNLDTSEMIQSNDDHHTAMVDSNNMINDRDGRRENSTVQFYDDENDDHYSQKSTYHDYPSFHPLRGLPNTPLPPSHLDYLAGIAAKEASRFDEVVNILGKFDQSALVAVGMILEEMCTTTLLPLAKAHIQACRDMEDDCQNIMASNPIDNTNRRMPNDVDYDDDEYDDDEHHDVESMNDPFVLEHRRKTMENELFHRRTLPPDEAIFRLFQEHRTHVQNVVTSSPTATNLTTIGLSSLYHPTRTLCHDKNGQEPDHAMAENWCVQHKLDLEMVQNNMDLFSIFLPVVPVDSTPQRSDRDYYLDFQKP